MNLIFTALIASALLLGGCRVMPQVIEDDALPDQNGRYFTILIENEINVAVTKKGSNAPQESVAKNMDPRVLREQGYAKCMIPAIKRYSHSARFLHPKWLYERLPDLKPESRSINDLDQFEHEVSRVEAAKALGLRYIISLRIRNEFNSTTYGEWVDSGVAMPPFGLTTTHGERVTSVTATVHDFLNPEHPQLIDIEVRRPHSGGLIFIIPYFYIPNTESEACVLLGESVGKYFNGSASEDLLPLSIPHSNQ